MTLLQAIVAIVVALVSALGGSFFGYKQFLIKRQDEKEEKNIQTLIDSAIDKNNEKLRAEIKESANKMLKDCGAIGDKAIADMKNEVVEQLEQGLEARGLEGLKRFEINSEQITQNTSMIKEVLSIQKHTNEKFDKLAESLVALNEATTSNAKLAKACAEGMRSTTYDRVLLVANRALKRGAITITEKTNLKQLYSSYIELQGMDPKMETIYNECMNLKTIPDEEEHNYDKKGG